MRIISSFHDYYDSVQIHGQTDLLYLRETKRIFAKDDNSIREFFSKNHIKSLCHYMWGGIPDDATLLFYPVRANLEYNRTSLTNINIKTSLLIVGNDVYPFVSFVSLSNQNNNLFFYDADLLESFFDEINPDPFHESFKRSKRWKNNLAPFLLNHLNQSYTIKHDFNVPLILVESDYSGNLFVELNPRLVNYDFFKKENHFSIYQKIEQDLMSRLVNEIDPGSVPEKFRWEAKGFDSKTSFRKAGSI